MPHPYRRMREKTTLRAVESASRAGNPGQPVLTLHNPAISGRQSMAAEHSAEFAEFQALQERGRHLRGA